MRHVVMAANVDDDFAALHPRTKRCRVVIACAAGFNTLKHHADMNANAIMVLPDTVDQYLQAVG